MRHFIRQKPRQIGLLTLAGIGLGAGKHSHSLYSKQALRKKSAEIKIEENSDGGVYIM